VRLPAVFFFKMTLLFSRDKSESFRNSIFKNTLLDDIESSAIEMFKVDSARTIDKLEQSGDGSNLTCYSVVGQC
jgi:hypothetical protein